MISGTLDRDGRNTATTTGQLSDRQRAAAPDGAGGRQRKMWVAVLRVAPPTQTCSAGNDMGMFLPWL